MLIRVTDLVMHGRFATGNDSNRTFSIRNVRNDLIDLHDRMGIYIP